MLVVASKNLLRRTSRVVVGFWAKAVKTQKREASQFLYSDVYGPPNVEGKTPLVIAHGMLGSGANFQSLAKAIHKKTTRQVITYDARNHGASFHSDSMSYTDMAADLVKLIQTKTNGKAILMGHSMGGRTVMYTALTHPEVVESLVVVDVSPVNVQFSTMDATSWNMSHFFHAMKAVRFLQPTAIEKWSISKARKDADEQLSHRIKDPGLRSWLLMNMVLDNGEVKWRQNLEVIHEAFENDIRTFPTLNPPLTFDKKTVFIGGANSEYIPVEDHPEILETFPSATFEYVKGAGHWVHSEKPAQFLELVLKHLK